MSKIQGTQVGNSPVFVGTVTAPIIQTTPQSADPGSPAQGQLQYADGTARAEGLWQYSGATWTLVGTATESITALYYVSANFAASTTVPINFDTSEYDPNSTVTTSPTAWKFTAPSTGLYLVTMFAGCGTVSTATFIYKNGTIYKHLTFTNANIASASGSASIYLNSGDYIDVRPNAARTMTGGALSTSGTTNISIVKIGN
jgi:hypothetical protein